MSKKLPLPKQVSAEEIQKVFEAHGFKTVGEKVISVDLCDMLQPLLTIIQSVQWWADLCRMNGIQFPFKVDDPHLQGIAIHSCMKGQQVHLARFNTLDGVLNMARDYLQGLRTYGVEPAIHAERLADVGETQIQNENLDTYAPTLLHLLSLVLPPRPRETDQTAAA